MPQQLLIELPAEMQSFFQESGYTCSLENEFRSRARLNVRAEATIEFKILPRALAQLETPHHADSTGHVLIKDISKSGISILYHEQIFPGEQFDICFRGRLIKTIAARCGRLGDKCYEIGGNILCLECI